MVSLGEKFQVSKTCEKILYEHIRVVPCKKQLEKLVNIIEMRRFLKLAKMATMQRLYSLGKMVSLGQKLNEPKRCKKILYKHIKVVPSRKQLEI